MNKICGNCRFLGEAILHRIEKGNEYIYEPTGYFLCDRIKHGNSTDRTYYPLDPPLGEKAFVKDSSGYHAALCVESDFGCNLWRGQDKI